MKYLTSGVVGGRPLPFGNFEKSRQSHERLDTETMLSKAKHRKVQRDLRDGNVPAAGIAATQCFTEDEIKKGQCC